MTDLHESLGNIAGAEVLLVACDYDGTLSPIVSIPSLARPDPEALVALEHLCVTQLLPGSGNLSRRRRHFQPQLAGPTRDGFLSLFKIRHPAIEADELPICRQVGVCLVGIRLLHVSRLQVERTLRSCDGRMRARSRFERFRWCLGLRDICW